MFVVGVACDFDFDLFDVWPLICYNCVLTALPLGVMCTRGLCTPVTACPGTPDHDVNSECQTFTCVLSS